MVTKRMRALLVRPGLDAAGVGSPDFWETRWLKKNKVCLHQGAFDRFFGKYVPDALRSLDQAYQQACLPSEPPLPLRSIQNWQTATFPNRQTPHVAGASESMILTARMHHFWETCRSQVSAIAWWHQADDELDPTK
jgi:hypothetical protein